MSPDEFDTNDLDPQTVTRLLVDLRNGSREAFDELFPLVYAELRQAATRQRRGWQDDETLDTTALVHEAYLKLVDQTSPDWQCRTHFVAVAARAMRQILIDHARRRCAAKRGGRREPRSLNEIQIAMDGGGDPSEAGSEALIALDAALRRLESLDSMQGQIVQCRFFGDMTIQDTSVALGISPATVKRGWAVARAWLYRDLKQAVEGPP